MKKKRSAVLPPGPRPIPIIGNVRGIDINAPWLTYTEWGEQYGDIVYSHFFDQEIIVINSEKVAIELLEKRSRNYSDRPKLPTNALFGLDFNTIFMAYGARWRRQRRIFHQAFRAQPTLSYHPMQQRKVQVLIHNLLHTPHEFISHLHMYSSSVIMSVLYDYDTKPRNDPLVEVVGRALELAVQELRPEVAAVLNAFPILLRLPAWIPGMSIKKKAAQSREWVRDWMEDPYNYVLKRMAEGTARSSMVLDALKRTGTEDRSSQTIKESAATAFAGEHRYSTASILQVFTLAMVLFPEVQAKAHSLIDAVVNESGLPTFEDRPALQYIDAIFRETLRWHPILPLAIPHASVNSDIYDGYYIPKGLTFHASHRKYPNPSQFLPERFLDDDGNLNEDTVGVVFGFGRRICVGRHLADASLWIAMSCMLARFTFSKARDLNGDVIDFEPRWSSGLAIHPLPFPCTITPRARKADI
ncbi:cytochrome P450 [Rhizopogon salebrosus TDB-379]|nr:cytochrome P450 [Rhizopogon salebrosus TDB-379]